jgi:hypothetical protein
MADVFTSKLGLIAALTAGSWIALGSLAFGVLTKLA